MVWISSNWGVASLKFTLQILTVASAAPEAKTPSLEATAKQLIEPPWLLRVINPSKSTYLGVKARHTRKVWSPEPLSMIWGWPSGRGKNLTALTLSVCPRRKAWTPRC